MASDERLRALPSVDRLVASLDGQFPHALAVSEARRLLLAERQYILNGKAVPEIPIENRLRAALQELARPSLRRVINATGVILHTNLGRAPLLPVPLLPGYSNLEYDLDSGRRGKRDVHVSRLLEALLGAPAIVVNNNAAAVFLVIDELAAGGEVLVSRGELIEIGDGFRIPDIMSRSSRLREVGTTNKTNLADYQEALSPATRLIMRVHPSNFHITGFTGKPPLADLCALANEHGIPLYEDLGSGCVVDLASFGVSEPLVAQSLQAGVSVVSFSGDKLLGGPQAGIIAGRADLIQRIRRNPLYRALRLDKILLQMLSETLRHLVFGDLEKIPALAMIQTSAETIRERAVRFQQLLPEGAADLLPGDSVVGGGSTPDQSLPTWLLVIHANPVEMEKELRNSDPPVIVRIENDRAVIDLRTVALDEEPQLVNALQNALKPLHPSR